MSLIHVISLFPLQRQASFGSIFLLSLTKGIGLTIIHENRNSMVFITKGRILADQHLSAMESGSRFLFATAK